jgi:hypothetical protein
MKNPALITLNFRDLLQYGGMPPRVAGTYPTEQPCTGYCTSCEEQGLVPEGAFFLDKLSHGADTWDFEQVLGPLPASAPARDFPVVFLLESPGGEHDYWKPRTSPPIKRPPTLGYYWVPTRTPAWPLDSKEAEKEEYGGQFAFMIRHYGLKQAYFTNIVKCSLAAEWKKGGYFPYTLKDEVDAPSRSLQERIVANCFSRFLRRELEIIQPRLVFYFGDNAARIGKSLGLRERFPPTCATLYHPAASKNPYQPITLQEGVCRSMKALGDGLGEVEGRGISVS